MLLEEEEDHHHHPHPKTLKYPTSSTDVGITTKPDQRLVEAGGEEDRQPHPKTLKHPTSSTDVGTSTKPDIPTVFIKSRHDDGPYLGKPMPESNPDDLIRRTFILPPGDNGERLRAKVTRKVVEVIKKADGGKVQNLSYILGIGNGKVEEIIPYSQLPDHLEVVANEDNEISDDPYKFRGLIGHQGPLKAPHPNWKGCKYNVLVDWETGEKTYEPLSTLAADNPVTFATYTKENDFYILMVGKGSGTDRIPSTTPGAEPPRDAKDSGSARSHSTHLETSSSDRP